MADAGERWFRVRGCLACHRVDGVDVAGPYLNGVTVRRDYDWFRGMVLRPDSMIRVDPVARDLAEIYRVAMPIQGVNDLHVRALWEYLRRVDGRAGLPRRRGNRRSLAPSGSNARVTMYPSLGAISHPGRDAEFTTLVVPERPVVCCQHVS
jgi:hypothetical protein